MAGSFGINRQPTIDACLQLNFATAAVEDKLHIVDVIPGGPKAHTLTKQDLLFLDI